MRGYTNAVYGLKLLHDILSTLRGGAQTANQLYYKMKGNSPSTVYKYAYEFERLGLLQSSRRDSGGNRGEQSQVLYFELTDKGREIIPALEKLQSVL